MPEDFAKCLSNVAVSPLAQRRLEETGVRLEALLTRHVNNDYGEIDPEQALKNDLAFYNASSEVISAFPPFVIITRWNQTLTLVSLRTELDI
jgi:hypothetical protein